MTKRGKLIVIEGTDGSGKTTQSKLLVEELEKQGHSVKTIDFPQYGKPSSKNVEDYLAGKLGTAEEVGPYNASKFFAEDRKEAGPKIEEWLEQGNIVIANRYQESNKGHQAGKIKDPEERNKFIKWVDDLEYNQNKIPRSDIVVFLHVPADIAQRLAIARGGRKDIHEEDIDHLKDAEKVYLEIAEKENWIMIECAKDDDIMPIEEIKEILWEKIKDLV